MNKSALPYILALSTLLINGCSSSGSDPINPPSGDQTPPSFSGANNAQMSGADSILVSWNNASDNASAAADIKYNVYLAQSSTNQDFTTPFASDTGVTSTTITGVNNKVDNYIIVRAEDEAGNEESNNVQIKVTGDAQAPVFAGISGISQDTIAPLSSTELQLQWTAASDNATATDAIKYNIYVSTSGSQFATSVTGLGASNITYTLTGLEGSTTYSVNVKAEDLAGNEDTNTVELQATTLTAKSFATDIAPIFQSNCALSGCHTDPAPRAGLNLSVDPYSALVNINSSCNKWYITPGLPDDSYVIDKIQNNIANICSGTKMPPIGSITDQEIQNLIDWITEGALNN